MDARTYRSNEARPPSQALLAALPANAVNWIAVWRRNYLVWKKLALASMFGNLADPMIYLFGLGFGLGLMVGRVDGVSYIAFLAAGTVASSVMMSASFESMYSGFSRMHVQRTWEAIMHTPLTLGDIVLGEVIWAASKSVLSGVAIMLVAGALGYASFPSMLLALPVIVLTGLAFASVAMVVTALAPSYDFFMFYQTLVLTPMLLLSGVFFPISQLPAAARGAAQVLPLAHAVDLLRPAMLARPLDNALSHVVVLTVYAVGGFVVSAVLFRRRMMK
ncbi:nodulation factor export ABC transporter transmembrane subunit NodJ [Paraburkholderia sp. GV068]|uniref:ABC transporter permease n=1 Tax=Paraburkholderia TaxID=1822464 RepID=UPI000D314C32|nr:MULTISPECIES: ABC transporter permease [Paraburkholderia]AXF07837.1 nodulation protein NodJ [Paraburkholderia graminis]MDR6466595.1 lipooligosaccharide transport system permease protein [Paraburkholderia graminis]MDR6474129.1 lipooligosaccharide transport system permease protein [Paraburkholderia graminis]PTR00336.1 nodulation factor export ABC transporter transmembrane subunit NodJ [Paraburkholderia sp. GV072]PUB05184.1 nodulation factor export ABC transporter transmembrane subunit NodJ [P